MGHLGVVLYEYLGEEYPEVLGSILGALKAIVNVIGTSPYDALVYTPFLSSSRFQDSKRKHLHNYLISFVSRHRYAQDDPAHQRPAPSSDSHPEEQAREGAGELHRPGGPHRRQVGRIKTLLVDPIVA